MHRQTHSAEETEAFGARLANSRPPGVSFAVVYLTGDLGAGKTTLARGFLRACGVAGPVRSPTYTLIEAYETKDVSVVHLDLYRLVSAEEIEGLGLRDWARSGCVWLVEWPERGRGQLPPADLTVTLVAGPAGHDIDVTAGSALGESWLEAMYDGAAT